ncbi:hypothetical protein AALO_G00035280, partial [Alosa alosa]
ARYGRRLSGATVRVPNLHKLSSWSFAAFSIQVHFSSRLELFCMSMMLAKLSRFPSSDVSLNFFVTLIMHFSLSFSKMFLLPSVSPFPCPFSLVVSLSPPSLFLAAVLDTASAMALPLASMVSCLVCAFTLITASSFGSCIASNNSATICPFLMGHCFTHGGGFPVSLTGSISNSPQSFLPLAHAGCSRRSSLFSLLRFHKTSPSPSPMAMVTGAVCFRLHFSPVGPPAVLMTPDRGILCFSNRSDEKTLSSAPVSIKNSILMCSSSKAVA